jgi:K+-transporting ATPase KdpF subunit
LVLGKHPAAGLPGRAPARLRKEMSLEFLVAGAVALLLLGYLLYALIRPERF